jgi:hypothetical protein
MIKNKKTKFKISQKIFLLIILNHSISVSIPIYRCPLIIFAESINKVDLEKKIYIYTKFNFVFNDKNNSIVDTLRILTITKSFFRIYIFRS